MKSIRNLILDMDGVLWRGTTPMPGLKQFFATLDDLGINYVLATNNASKTVEQYITKFAGFDIEMAPWRILTSAEASGSYLAQHYPEGSSAYVVGGDGLRVALSSRGFRVFGSADYDFSTKENPEPVKFVIIGFTQSVNYPDFAYAAYHIGKGASFYGSNPDVTFPSEMGNIPGAGSLIALVEAAVGQKAAGMMGKPSPIMYQEALRLLNGSAEDTMMVGDRLGTDVDGANRVGLRSTLVLSGITQPDEVDSSPIQPTYVFDNISVLAEKLKAANSATVAS